MPEIPLVLWEKIIEEATMRVLAKSGGEWHPTNEPGTLVFNFTGSHYRLCIGQAKDGSLRWNLTFITHNGVRVAYISNLTIDHLNIVLWHKTTELYRLGNDLAVGIEIPPALKEIASFFAKPNSS